MKGYNVVLCLYTILWYYHFKDTDTQEKETKNSEKDGKTMAKKFEVLDSLHEQTSDVVKNTVQSIKSEIYIQLNLQKIMDRRKLTQRDVAQITGLRLGTINGILNNRGTTINKIQLVAIMVGLRISDISELLEIRFSDEVIEQFDRESKEWDRTKVYPDTIKELIIENTIISMNKE